MVILWNRSENPFLELNFKGIYNTIHCSFQLKWTLVAVKHHQLLNIFSQIMMAGQFWPKNFTTVHDLWLNAFLCKQATGMVALENCVFISCLLLLTQSICFLVELNVGGIFYTNVIEQKRFNGIHRTFHSWTVAIYTQPKTLPHSSVLSCLMMMDIDVLLL